MSGIRYKTGTLAGKGKVGKKIKSMVSDPAKGSVIAEPNNLKDAKELFLKKIQICSRVYDYSDDSKDIKAKSERLMALQELRELFNDTKSVVNYVLPNLNLMIDMIRKNIFRPLPMEKKSSDKLGFSETGLEVDDIIVDPAWPHLQGVYELYFDLIVCEVTDIKSIKFHVNSTFVQEMLQLFDSEEPRERDHLKSILHQIYAKLISRRKMIRKAINDCLLTMIHETQRFNGASELLDILASIISGFAVPLREEHVIFFKTIIIPLHKVQTSNNFYDQLLRCSLLFLRKDNSLAIPLVEGLLRYWPFGNSPKEISYLNELNQIIEFCELSKLEPLVPKLVKRLIRCISGPQLQVSDQAMQFFENDYFLRILKMFKTTAFPVIVPIIVDLARTHWHKVLLESFNALKSILKEIDPVAFECALQGSKDSIRNNSLNAMHHLPKRAALESQWEALVKKAKTLDPSLSLSILPYVENHVVGLHNMNRIELSSNNLIPPV